MDKRLKYWIMILTIAGFSYTVYSQNPPEPMSDAQASNNTWTPCDRAEDPGDPGDPGDGSPPPPPGFCLPINDYLLPLLLSGMALGAFYLVRTEKLRELKNSTP